MIQGSTIFVTGGTGFVGSHLVEHLLDAGARSVRCLVRSDPKWLARLPITHVPGDLSKDGFPLEALDGVDYVFHVAALTRARHRSAFEAVNVWGTDHLLDAIQARAPSLRRLLITSSLAVVGKGTSDIANETSPLDPVSLYGWSKARMEASVRERMDRLPITIVRPPAVYGPRETDILTFFQTVSKGLCPVVGSVDTPSLTLVHVDDLVRGMVLAATSEDGIGGTFFLGSREPVSWGRIRDVTAQALGRGVFTVRIPRALVPVVGALSEGWGRLTGSYPPLNREKAREINQACIMCDSSLAWTTFGYAPEIRLESGITQTIDWYQSEGWL